MISHSSSLTISSAEKVARLRLFRTDSIGPITYRDLLTHFSTAEDVLKHLPDLVTKSGRKKALTVYPKSKAEDELAALSKLGGTALFVDTAGYPDRLAAIDDAPPVLFALGFPDLLNRDSVAVVGARNASAAGRKITRTLAKDLSDRGLVITSGLARGVDAAAHAAALAGGTVACLAGGADSIYPRENEALYWDIRDQGCIVSEMSLGTKAQARHFPRRNRIVSGLSLGVLVTEAAERSGTLITARFALEQGREVFAVPGSPLDPRAKGTNSLIRQGACLVESVQDIIDELEGLKSRLAREDDDLPLFRGLSNAPDIDQKDLDLILELLGPTPVHLDEIIRESGCDAGTVQSAVLLLEIGGHALRYSGGRVARIESL